MEINWKLLPLKLHYFIFLGAMSPILPFVMVIVRQLGIPVVAQGSVAFFALLVTIVAKPLIGLAADAFPKARKFIFICVLVTLYFGLTSICFLPSIYEKVEMKGQSIVSCEEMPRELKCSGESHADMHISVPKQGDCFVSEAWDCMVPCDFNGNKSIINIKHVMLETAPALEMFKNISESVFVYKLTGHDQTSCDPYQQINFECKGGIYTGDGCPSLLSIGVFWVYILLYTAGQVCYTTANSITDAICLDCIGKDGDYGAQRAWGTVGWGVAAPISGFLIDWWSGTTYSKDYAPVIVIVLGLALLDLIVTTVKLRVPKLDGGGNVWKTAKSVVKQPQFMLFLAFVIMNGTFDGILLLYIFILQEEMAEGTIYMSYMKFIQGATLAAQCSLEAPFMWMFSWFLKRMSAVSIMKIVLFLYTIRMFILALIGSYGPVWATLLCELLNGPCYGLGYTSIVVQAGNLSPPGTSATIQSVVNIGYESIGYGISGLAGGLIFHKLGARGIYYVYGVVAAITFVAYLMSASFLSQLNTTITKKYLNGSNDSSSVKAPTNNDNIESENLMTGNINSPAV